jgi:hypothetical protein
MAGKRRHHCRTGRIVELAPTKTPALPPDSWLAQIIQAGSWLPPAQPATRGFEGELQDPGTTAWQCRGLTGPHGFLSGRAGMPRFMSRALRRGRNSTDDDRACHVAAILSSRLAPPATRSAAEDPVAHAVTAAMLTCFGSSLASQPRPASPTAPASSPSRASPLRRVAYGARPGQSPRYPMVRG